MGIVSFFLKIMRLKSREIIYGVEAKKLREFFRKFCYSDQFYVDEFQNYFNINNKKCDETVNKMIDDKILNLHKSNKFYNLLPKALAIKNTKFVKPITKDKAKIYIQDFLHRVTELNNNNFFVMFVQEVLTFGSFNSSSIDCADIDLVVYLKKRKIFENVDITNLAYKRAPKGSNILETLNWPIYEEPIRFLKAKNKYLSFHTRDGIDQEVKLYSIFKSHEKI